jgi:two-component system sensor histidine kinase/response regulator
LGDPLRLSQIINNFLGNAVKFTEAGQIVIRVQNMARTPDQQHLLKFSVTDTGVGIAPQAIGHLFEAFTQADASITRRYGGTGLGLTICKKLVSMMGGHIGVDSQLGHGSSFWFTLALPEAPGGQQTSRASVTPPSPSEPLWMAPSTSTEATHRPTQRAWHDRSAPLLGARVLLAEDNRLNQLVAQELLSRMGMSVTLAETGDDALRILGEHPPHYFAAVLMDLHMPVMDGLEATRHIRAMPLFAHLPVIAMTASAMPEDRSASLAAGMTDYVTKPVMPDQLLDVLLRRINMAEHAARILQQPLSRGGTGLPPETKVEAMAGFDLPALLIRVNGNRGLMWALLHQFARSEAHAGDTLARMMATGDLEGARRKVHDLKGCSANLGMVDVAQASADLEAALRQGQLDGTRLASLQQALRRSLALIALNLALYEGGTPLTRH